MKSIFVIPAVLAALPWSLRAQDTTSTAADTAAADTAYVEYSVSPITLPLGVGLRIPSYDRVNGLTLPWGPQILLGYDKFQLDPLVSYRSNLGKWDPSIEALIRPSAADEIRLYVGRGTFTNDSWIRSDLFNSAAAFFVGSDARNYYRGDRATLRVTRTIPTSAITFTPFIAGNLERDWSTGSLTPEKYPWSVFGRSGRLRMRRLNPPVARGRLTSILGGTGILASRGGLEAKLDAAVEYALNTSFDAVCTLIPANGSCLSPPESFTQITLDSRVTFPTFGAHTFAFIGHALLTGGGDIPPPQRFGYLGGAGTLATVDLLALGGDRLLFVQGDYTIPIERIQLPFLGSPFIAFRYAAGNAGVGRLPSLIQNLGVGAGIGFFRVDYTIDPAENRSPVSRRSAVTFGVSLSL